MKYKKLYNNGKYEVKYIKSKNNKYGRVNPVNSLGGHNMRKETRHTLFSKYIDIDIVNAHPILLE